MNTPQLLEAASALVKEVGQWMYIERQTFDLDRVELKGRADLVSYVDRTAEERLVAGLSALMPDSAFITEEGTITQAQSLEKLTWIIDPLDGTTNFVHGLPPYSVSVALYDANGPVLGIVYECHGQELFTAIAGSGECYLNGKPVRVSSAATLSESLLVTGFPYKLFDNVADYIALMREFMTQTHGVRRLGSAAVDLAYTAAGRLEGFYEHRLKPWDVAAGLILVKEAGGRVSDFSGQGDALFSGELVASNHHIHDAMLEVIANFFPVTKESPNA